MITYGYTGVRLEAELDLAQRLGAEVLEILPDWRALPDAGVVRRAVADRGLSIHSAHGCWGGMAIKASRVDLGETDPAVSRRVGGRSETMHRLASRSRRHLPGSTSRRPFVRWSLEARGALPGTRTGSSWLTMPRAAGWSSASKTCRPGVHPGSLMGELFELLGRARSARSGPGTRYRACPYLGRPRRGDRGCGEPAGHDSRTRQ